MLQASKKPGELDNAMWDEIGTENGVFESRHCSDTVASAVARGDEENTKFGISCGQPVREFSGFLRPVCCPHARPHGIPRGVYLSIFRAF